MKHILRNLLYGIMVFGGIFLLYIVILMYPQPFFAYHVQVGNLSVYLDEPASDSLYSTLHKVNEKLNASGLNNPTVENKVFLTGSSAKFAFFTTVFYRAGGINYSYLNGNSFLRPANIASNRLIGPSGREVQGERTLDYFIAHEATHGLTVNRIGRKNYWFMPIWVREGYADYVGKRSIDFVQAIKELKEDDPKMNYEKTGLYARYHLLVAYLLERKRISVEELFAGSFHVEQLEQELRGL